MATPLSLIPKSFKNIALSSGSSNSGEVGAADVKTSGLELNAGVRYFFTPADKFSLSLGGVFGYGSTKEGEFCCEWGWSSKNGEVILPEGKM